MSLEQTEADHQGDLAGLARGSILNVGGVAAFGVLNLALVVVVSRSLHAQGTGLFFEAVALFMIAATAATAGADAGMVWVVSKKRALGTSNHLSSYLSISLVPVLVLGTALAVAGAMSAPSLARVLAPGEGSHTLATYLRTMAPFLPLASATLVVLAGTRGLGTMLPTVIVDRVATQAVRPAACMVVLGLGAGTIALALAWSIPAAAAFVLSLFWLRSLLSREQSVATTRAVGPFDRGLTGEFWGFAAPRALAGVFQIGVLWLDVLLLGALRSTSEAGVYAAVGRIATTASFPLMAIVVAIAPQISGLLAAGENRRARRLYRTATSWAMVVALPIYLTMAIFAPAVLGIFGAGFKGGETALVVLSIGMIVNIVTGPVNMVLLMSGRSGLNLANAFLTLIVNIGLNLILIPRMGITGAAVAWAVSVAVENLVPLVEVWLLLGLNPLGLEFTVAGVAAVACFGGGGIIGRMVLGDSLPALILTGVCATLGYIAWVWRSRRVFNVPGRGQILRKSSVSVPSEVAIGSVAGR